MNNEIKEILDKAKEISKYGADGKQHIRFFNQFEAKLLLDYITNLEQENKEWDMIFDTFSKRPYAHKYLEEKRKELGNDKIIGLDSEMIYKDYYDYKSRCEKAIEYIKYNDSDLYTFVPDYDYEENLVDNYESSSFREDLLNILQNGSDSQ